MPNLTKAIHGAPCWIDLTTRGLDQAKEFYGELFGWSFSDMGPEFGGYNIVSKDGADIGGAMEFNADFMPADTPDSWGVYFSVEDINATLEKMKADGATPIMEPMTVETQGTNVFVIDPTGAGVGLWQPMDRIGFDRWGEPGFPAWFELHTRDFDTATQFYTSTLGVQAGANEMGEGMRYHTLDVDGEAHAGIWDVNGVLPDEVPGGWNVYINVADVDATLEKTRKLGGTVSMEPEDTEYGRMAVIQDPNGVALSVIGDRPAENEAPD